MTSVISSRRNVDKDVAARTDVGKRFQVLPWCGYWEGTVAELHVDLDVDVDLHVDGMMNVVIRWMNADADDHA